MSKVTYFKTAGGVFLDPQEVSSSVVYRAKVSRDGHLRFSAEVECRDCDDTCRWSGYGANGAQHLITKIDRAIAMLRKARGAVERAGAEYAKRSRKKRK